MGRFIRQYFLYLIILVIYIVYISIFIYDTSFKLADERYFSLFDDAMVSMQYARNLIEGHGLVWNADGARVEGFSNPLWTGYMALVHLFPIPESKVSLVIQITSGLLLILNLWVVRSIYRMMFRGNPFFEIATIILTAFFLPLNNWSLQGMEVGLVTLWISTSTLLILRLPRLDKIPWTLLFFMAVGTLVRLDLIIFYLIGAFYIGLKCSASRNRRFINVLIPLIIVLSIQILARYYYYGALLPNTYYLKMTGFPVHLRVARGLLVFGKFIQELGLPAVMIFFLLFLFNRSKAVLMVLTIFGMQVVYSIWVGGDAWEYWGLSNRFITPVMPLFFIMFAGSLQSLFELIIQKRKLERSKTSWLINAGFVVLFLICFIRFNLVRNPDPSLKEWLLLKKPLAVERNLDMVNQALLLRSLTTDDVSLAVVWAGALPYFSHRRCIDILGKNDPVIAREKASVPKGEERFAAFYPGHNKWDYRYSIGKLKPDIVVQLYGIDAEDIEPYIAREYWKVLFKGYVWHIRQDCTGVNWDVINSFGKKWKHQDSIY